MASCIIYPLFFDKNIATSIIRINITTPIIPIQPILIMRMTVTPISIIGKEVHNTGVNSLFSKIARSFEMRLVILPISEDFREEKVSFYILA